MSNIDKHSYNFIKDFSDDIIISIILNDFNENEKIDILRNKDFIDRMPSYILETILNNMHFVSVFNMLQNNTLLSKINEINIKLSTKDYLFIPDCLNQEELIRKINHQMLKNMLITLSKEEVINYLKIHYIQNKLTYDDIIDISSAKKINLVKDVSFINKLNKEQIIRYINIMWSSNINYSLIDNDYVKKILFDNDIDNMDEIIYLYELLTTKNNHNVKNIVHSIDSFTSVYKCYKLFGFDNTMTLLDKKNRGLNDITSVFSNIDINKATSNKKIIDFINIYYRDVLDNKYNKLVINFGLMVNNYKDSYNKYNDLYELENYLLKKYKINNNIPKRIIKSFFDSNNNQDLSSLANQLNDELINVSNKEEVIPGFFVKHDNYEIKVVVNNYELLLYPNMQENEFKLKVTYDNNTFIIDGKRNGNMVYLNDKSNMDISKAIKIFCDLIIDYSKDSEYPINYIFINSKRYNNGLRISSDFSNEDNYNILVSSNRPLDITNIRTKTNQIKKGR